MSNHAQRGTLRAEPENDLLVFASFIPNPEVTKTGNGLLRI